MTHLDTALLHLKQDPIMSGLIQKYPRLEWTEPRQINLFAKVVESIISQQLSVKVADVIFDRFIQLFPDGHFVPTAVIDLEPEQIRQCGISYAKVRYIRSAAEASLSGLVDFEALPELEDQAVIAELIKIHGVGQWTAEMLLISALQRPDVFSVGDLGLRTAVSRLYGIEREDKKAILSKAEQWAPYHSLASRYLWMSLDNK